MIHRIAPNIDPYTYSGTHACQYSKWHSRDPAYDQDGIVPADVDTLLARQPDEEPDDDEEE